MTPAWKFVSITLALSLLVSFAARVWVSKSTANDIGDAFWIVAMIYRIFADEKRSKSNGED